MNEDIGGNYILFITESDQFITNSISTIDISKKILTNYNINTTDYKRNQKTITN